MKRKIFRIVAVVAVVAFIAAIPFVPVSKKEAKGQSTAYTVLEFWHIETFEGGLYSRASWLSNRAKEFERANKGVIVHLNVLTIEQMTTLLDSGSSFDLVSFSVGAGEKLLPFLKQYGGAMNVRTDLAQYGIADGVQMAVPYLLGGYCLAAREENLRGLLYPDDLIKNIFSAQTDKKSGKNVIHLKSLDYGAGAYNIPALALAENNAPRGALEVTQKTQYEAYEGFLHNNVSTLLLGTQRDLSRLQGRVKNGKLGAVVYQFLEGFSDLVQYVALGSGKEKAAKLIEYITSDKAQKTVSGLEMFCVTGADIHTDEVFVKMQAALNKPLKSINVFTSASNIDGIRQSAYDSLKN